MSKLQIKQLIENQVFDNGLTETGVKGVKLFRIIEPLRCAPAVYEPSLTVIVSGDKEAILEGQKLAFDSSQYICCTMSKPVEAGTPNASPDNPLIGVHISLDTKVMTELTIEMGSTAGVIRPTQSHLVAQGVALAHWDEAFTEALLRLLQLGHSPVDMAILGDGRLQELYYAVLKGEAGDCVRQAFSVDNDIAQAIEYLSSRLNETVTIDEMAAQVGMSRAVFHRKFKLATSMSPIQFVKSMRLNTAAMKIAGGMSVSEAAMRVGYISSSQFSREFKRMYGQSPKQWSHSHQLPAGMA